MSKNSFDMQSGEYNKTKMKKKDKYFIVLALSGWVLVALSVLLAIVLFFAGRLVISIKEPVSSVVILQNVCGDQIVNKYNSSFDQENIETSSKMLKDLATEVSKMGNYDKDPNCLYINYAYYRSIGEFDKAFTYATKMADILKTNNAYLNNNLYMPSTVSDIIKTVDGLNSGPSQPASPTGDSG